MISGCSTIDPVDGRAITVNNSVNEYVNDATLMNIVRAANHEPMTFLALSQVQGHNTISGTLGIPTEYIGPHQTLTQKLQTFGPNSLSRSASNDFTLNAIDDQNTYAALYSPVTPASLALLIGQGYPREFLFKLLVERIRIWVPNGNRLFDGSVAATDGWHTYINSARRPIDEEKRTIPNELSSDQFNLIVDQLINEGLTIQYNPSAGIFAVDATSVPNYKICFDSEGVGGIYPQKRRNRFSDNKLSLEKAESGDADCDSDKMNWSTTATGPVATPSGYRVPLIKNGKVEIHFRSIYGTYRFISEFVYPDVASPDRIFIPIKGAQEEGEDNSLIQVNISNKSSSFARVKYGGQNYIVPDNAYNTKNAFAVLHQLVQLYSKPSNASGNTINAKLTP